MPKVGEMVWWLLYDREYLGSGFRTHIRKLDTMVHMLVTPVLGVWS